MSGTPYQYFVVRCVPRVEREEFVNVGVVLFADQVGYLDAAFAIDEDRLRALDPHLDVASVSASLEVIADVCRGVAAPGRPDLPTPGKRFGWLSAPRSTLLQPGPRHGGLTDDPEQELSALLARLVACPAQRPARRA